jgi:hypothetical protein
MRRRERGTNAVHNKGKLLHLEAFLCFYNWICFVHIYLKAYHKLIYNIRGSNAVNSRHNDEITYKGTLTPISSFPSLIYS